ncbi:MAG: hypothetical protein AAGB14_05305, partial [Verrucomicrobiota bacterium]
MTETLFETRWLGVYRIGHWDFVRRPNADYAVGILAITADDEILLVEQFRIPVQQRVIEIPAGLVGDEEEHRGEALESQAALRPPRQMPLGSVSTQSAEGETHGKPRA